MQTMVPTAGGVQNVLVPQEVPPVATPAGDSMAVQPPESDELVAGAKAGPWIVERELGHGGMGAVYGVVHEEIGKRAALKVMHRRLVNRSSIERILLEAKVVNQVGHPNIIDIFETGTLDDGRPYILMERLDGVSLAQRADEGKILPDQVISILLQVCDALIAAHAAGVVHRDLKLDNIFLIDNPEDPSNPKVKLLDWGIAKVISNDIRNTIDGQLVGTPQYLAPEQARGAAVSAKTDVYSLGVMAYELFLEQLPFEAETSAEIMAMHLRATPPPPSDMWPDMPATLENLLLAMMAKNPDSRPTTLTVAHTLELARDELLNKRDQIAAEGATVAPELPRAVRWSSAPGLAPTEPATWQEPKRRWQFVVGAFALAASAAMFIISRDTDSAAAAASPSHQATAAISDEAPGAPTAPEIAQPDPTIEMPADPITRRSSGGGHHVSNRNAAHHHAPARKAPVMPRRVLPIDPNGTVDPY
jgi:serine/threonine protein kinase